MTVTITRSPTASGIANTITPLLVLGYAYARESNNIVHPVIGSNSPDVTVANASPRAGTFLFLMADRNAAFQCEMFHHTAGTFTLVDTDNLNLGVVYVLAEGGQIKVELDPETRVRWTVAVDFQGI